MIDRTHIWVPLGFGVIGVLWVVAGDLYLAHDGSGDALIPGLVKGVGFVLATTLFLYATLSLAYARRDTALQTASATAARLETMFLGHGLSQLVIDPVDGSILDANIKAVEWLERPRNRLTQLTVFDIATMPRDVIRDQMDAAVAQRLNTFVVDHTRSDGSRQKVEVHPYPISIDGRLVLYVTFVDVTQQKRAQQDLERLNATLKALISSLQAVLETHDRPGMAAEVCRALVDEAGYSLVWIGDVSERRENSVDVLAREVKPGTVESGSIGVPELSGTDNSLARAVHIGQPQRIRHLGIEDRRWLGLGEASALEIGSYVVLPMVIGGRVSSLLVICARETDAFSTENLQYLQILASSLGRSMTTIGGWTRLDKSERERIAALKRSKDSLLQLIEALSQLIAKHDPYTAEHERRVASLACRVARRMGMEEGRIEAMRIAGVLHDVGKFAIPSEILSKPGKLSDVEMALIREHVKIGVDVLEKVTFDWPIASYVAQHHERLDGSGYPLGISGDAILPESRVLAVADVTESMLTHRPYRQARSMEELVKELKDGSGRRYDAGVVDACLAVLAEEGMEPARSAETHRSA